MLRLESADAIIPCPVSFSEGEIAECWRISMAQEYIDEKLEKIRARIGINTDSWVPLRRYDHALAGNPKLKEELLAEETGKEGGS